MPTHAIWIEVNGYLPGSRPNKAGFTEKLNYLNQHNKTIIVVKNADELLTELKARNIT